MRAELVERQPISTYMDDLSRGVSWLVVRLASPIRLIRGEFSRPTE